MTSQRRASNGGLMIGALGIILLVMLSHTIAAAASYEIILHNGRSLKTSLYWKEAGEIRFFIYGGEMGVPASAVKEIRRIPDQNQSASQNTQNSPASGSAFDSPQDAGGQQTDEHAPDHSDVIQRFQEETAVLFHRSHLVSTMDREELLTFAKETESLKNRIVKSQAAQHLNPTLLQLDDLLEHLEKELRRRS